jgi:hypothetical protein
MEGYKFKFNKGMHEQGSDLEMKVLSTPVTVYYSSNSSSLKRTNDI